MSDVNAVTLFYQRGETIVKSVYTPEAKPGEHPPQAKTAHALRGTMNVNGFLFDTLERLDNYVCLVEGTYRCTLEESPGGRTERGWQDGKKRKRRQIRPSHNILTQRGTVAAILIHSGTRPHHFEGCIGVGYEEPKGLTDSVLCMDTMYFLLGDFEVGKTVSLTVKGTIPGKKK